MSELLGTDCCGLESDEDVWALFGYKTRTSDQQVVANDNCATKNCFLRFTFLLNLSSFLLYCLMDLIPEIFPCRPSARLSSFSVLNFSFGDPQLMASAVFVIILLS